MDGIDAEIDKIWFYEEDGQRAGPVSESEIAQLIKATKISYGTPVWKKGFPDWLVIEKTDLRVQLEAVAPPPLTGAHVNNTVVWVLAFAPILGYFLEAVAASFVYGDNNWLADKALASNEFWFITLVLNIGLSYFDERRLQRAGHNTDKFRGWIWFVPVYLYQRAKWMKQNLAYFIVWIVCFLISLSNP